MNLVTVQKEGIDQKWDEVEPLIKKVLIKQQNGYTIDNIKEMLLKEELQLWTSYDETQIQGICITHIAIYPQHKICEVFMCAGQEIDSWLDFIEQIQTWAKSLNCDFMEIQGRRGWERKMQKYGYSFENVILRKEL